MTLSEMIPLPLYCCICSAPCAVPRLELPLPARPSSTLRRADYPPPEWLRAWNCLRLSSGPVDPPSYLLQPPPDPHADFFPKKCVTIHVYCYQAVVQTVWKSPVINQSTTAYRDIGEDLILEWSIPRWTGDAPWSTPSVSNEGGETVEMGRENRFWKGTAGQRSRYERGEPHLRIGDEVSPMMIGEPKSTFFSLIDRPKQKSLLPTLPPSLISTICLELLGNPDLQSADLGKYPNSKLLKPEVVTTVLSFLQTCSGIYYSSLPSLVWVLLVRNSVRDFRLGLLNRWRASPTGFNSGSPSQLASALDASFVDPVEQALEQVAGESWTARDVWEWWMHHDGWRSRRRVWYCVVHGTATARDGDWW